MMIVVFLALLLKESQQEEPIFENAPEVYILNLNDSVLLPCRVTNQHTDYKRKVLFHWMKYKPDGSVVWNWPRYRIKPNKGLKIRQLHKYDEGVYFCNAESKLGGFKSVKRVLVVVGNASNEGPQEVQGPVHVGFKNPFFPQNVLEVTSALTKKKFNVGARAKLKCAVKGNPLPNIQWFINGTKIETSKHYIVQKSSLSLIIMNITLHNNGNYTCFAKNKYGMVHMSIDVEVEIPSIKMPTVIMDTVYIKPGENITLECAVPDKEVSLLQWHLPLKKADLSESRQNDIGRLMRQQTDIFEVHNNTRFKKILFVNVTREVHEGTYKCLALFKNSQIPSEIKVVRVLIALDAKSSFNQVHHVSIDSRITIFLLIVLPVACFILLIVFIFICLRRQKMQKKESGFKSVKDSFKKSTNDNSCKKDMSDLASLNCLIPCPTGTIKINHDKMYLSSLDRSPCPTESIQIHYDKIDLSSSGHSTHPPGSLKAYHDNTDLVSSCLAPCPTGSIRIHEEKADLLVDKLRYPDTCEILLNTPKVQSSVSLSKYGCNVATVNSKNHISRYLEKKTDTDIALNLSKFVGNIFNMTPTTKNYSLNIEKNRLKSCNVKVPRQEHFSGDSSNFDDKSEGILKQLNKDLNFKGLKIKKKKSSWIDDSSKHTLNICSCINNEDNISCLEIQEVPEKDDYLLEREIKNWELLIKNRSPYTSDRFS